jgi:hypothetical protein
MKIPKIIHQTHYEQNLESVIRSQLSIRKTNPDWEYKFWSNEMTENLVSNSFPEFAERWLSLKNTNIIKWDIFRLMIVHSEGGLYVDCDTIFNKSINEIINLNCEFVGTTKHKIKRWIKNYFFLGAKKSKFLYHCIQEIFSNLSLVDNIRGIHKISGGIFLYNQLIRFSSLNNFNYQLLNPVYISNINLKTEVHRGASELDQIVDLNEVYVVHLQEYSWRHKPKIKKKSR